MNYHPQRGVGLVEIMVAVVIASIGFLAAASMQVQGMRFSQSAYFRSQAYFMASEIIDRMRNNPSAVIEGLYSDQETSSTAINPQCDINDCDSTDMVVQDIYDWSASLHDFNGIGNFNPILPSGPTVQAKGEIELVDDNEYRVTLSWSETINGASQTQSLVVNFATESL